ncbi:MAG: hypothetical protein CMI50_16630 [Paracoccus sp.]|uniref:hypothetical protein n=1 Tax=unclassified Microbacterium TaxID=2609290 RepID=UPI000C513A07|nr:MULTISPECIES: hypothetical protein [unclassified Microbacterium]MAN58065.1 hypothetical protein [Paracoccus sp. (in: a-proteobacteria)]|tara:strand:+ start:21482 stop:22129 length:648 start_codon:yes stop_codon:yes gene_type:complete
MTWTRLSDTFHDDDAITELSHEAFRLHVYALTWCNKQLTNGAISTSRARRLLPEIDVTTAIDELVDAHLWTAQSEGFQVDWADQETAEEVRERQDRNAERQRKFRKRRELHDVGDHSECDPRFCNSSRNTSRNELEGKTPENTRERNALRNRGSNATPSRPGPSLTGTGTGSGRRASAEATDAPPANKIERGACRHRMLDDRYCEYGCPAEAVHA